MAKLEYSTHIKWYCAELFGEPPYMLAGGYEEFNYKSGLHMHDFFEICIVIDGECIHHIDSGCTHASRGTVMVVPPGIMHGFEQCENDNAHVINLFFHRLFFARYHADLSQLTAYPVVFSASGVLGRTTFTLNEKSMQELLPFCFALCREFKDRELQSSSLMNAVGLACVSELCVIYLRDFLRADGLKTDGAPVIKCVQYMQNNLENTVTLEELCAVSYLSRSTLRRGFITMFGMPPMQYLIGLRLQNARELLQSTSETISTIAQRCGFFDSAHFCRCFYTHTGISPGDFRKKYRVN